VHKSYIINVDAISSIQANKVSINNVVLPIGNVFAKNIKRTP
jgi:DNA-binding LytR/AlgR family response regulator